VTDAPRKRRTSATTVSPPAGAEDVVLVHGQSEDGAYRVLRKRGEELHVGEMRALEEGKALTPGGEVVALRPRADSPQLFDAQTLYRVPGEATAHTEASEPAAPALPSGEPSTVGGGPAQVSTPAYREGWGAIFGATRRRRSGQHTLN
jgi:hypothetical protein